MSPGRDDLFPYFANGGDEELYIGSADWMQQNLDRRVQVAVPLLAPDLKRCLKEKGLDAYLRDNVKARRLQPDGSYLRAFDVYKEALETIARTFTFNRLNGKAF
ncbi:MAG: hypothetical protein WKF74_02520 [Pyrinomonadaceae bacterium]